MTTEIFDDDRDLLTRISGFSGIPISEINTKEAEDIIASLIEETAGSEKVPVARFGSAI